MRPAKRLELLQRSALASLSRLRRCGDRNLAILGAATSSVEEQQTSRQVIAYCTIEALSIWTNFVRSYYLSCTLDPYRVRRGRVSHANVAVGTFEAALRLATGLFKPSKVPPSGPVHRRDEPAWHDPHVFVKCCGALSCSHTADVAAALSAPTRVLIDLPVLRNYFAHRNAGSEMAAQSVALQYAIPSNRHPLVILSTPPLKRPFPLLVEWVDELRVLVELLCE